MSRMCRRCGNLVVERDAEPWGRGFAHKEPPGCPDALSLSPRVRRMCGDCLGAGQYADGSGICRSCNGTGNVWENREEESQP